MYESLTIFISGITVIVGIFGLYLFLKFLSVWKNTDSEIIKARVSRSEKFLMKNILLIFIVGLLIVYHNFMEFLGLAYPDFYFGYLSVRYPTRLIAVTELLLALLITEWLMYKWIEITRE
ncbi:MAG: hypothetical protein FIB08_15150 [Candidatus Methanoperedens sp.]|nr:hypothetical protein [Candidatus Methanoperedens sp.]